MIRPNEHSEDRKIDDIEIDMLVDGELDDDARRDLIERLEIAPDGWRRFALAFLESQSWGESFAALRHEAGVVNDSTDASPVFGAMDTSSEPSAQKFGASMRPTVAAKRGFWNRSRRTLNIISIGIVSMVPMFIMLMVVSEIYNKAKIEIFGPGAEQHIAEGEAPGSGSTGDVLPQPDSANSNRTEIAVGSNTLPGTATDTIAQEDSTGSGVSPDRPLKWPEKQNPVHPALDGMNYDYAQGDFADSGAPLRMVTFNRPNEDGTNEPVFELPCYDLADRPQDEPIDLQPAGIEYGVEPIGDDAVREIRRLRSYRVIPLDADRYIVVPIDEINIRTVSEQYYQ